MEIDEKNTKKPEICEETPYDITKPCPKCGETHDGTEPWDGELPIDPLMVEEILDANILVEEELKDEL